MAHKLLAPFKKFPQQLPIFKKSSDKWKDISLSNYNSVYGMLDDVTSQSFDEKLNLLAVGTKRGEIKIYGAAGIIYTLVGCTLKSVNILRFLHGQGRLISVTTDNDILLWEYRVESLSWEVTSTLNLSTLAPNLGIISLDVSHTLLWKSQDDNLLQLLLIGLTNNSIRQVLIIGNRLHLYDGDDLTFDSEELLQRCSDISKEYEFGEIMSLKFNSTNKDRFLVAFNNGLILLMKSNALEPNSIVEETEAPKEEQVDTKIEKVDEVNEPTNDTVKPESEEEHNGESMKGKIGEEKEKVEGDAEKLEQEKPKPSDDTQKPDDGKVPVKKIKESVQVPSVSVKLPQILNYIVSDKKINTVCWSNNDVAVNYHESNDICFYRENEEGGKLTESNNIVTLPDGINNPISGLNYFKQGEIDMFTFVIKAEDHPNLLCLMVAGHIAAEFETASNIIDYVIVKDQVTDDNTDDDTAHARTLLVLCESQLVAIDLTSEQYSELRCPYLVLRTNSHVTAVTSIIQVSASLFPNHKTLHELFENWPLNTPLSCNDTTSDEILDILATGHSDGTIIIWQVMSCGVLSVLSSITNTDIFKNLPPKSHSISEVTLPRRRVGHHLISNENPLLRINNIQLIHNSTDDSSDSVGNGLFCVAGNSSGTVFVLKFDRSEVGNNLSEITSNLKELHEKDDIVWNDSDAPEFLELAEISGHVPNLSHIIKLSPSLPVTSLAFQSQWSILAIGCTYGLALVDLKQNDTVFSYSTLIRASKSVPQVPLTVGQQLRKSMRLSFRKLKKFKPTAKHASSDDKSKDKTEVKPDDAKPEETKSDEVKSEETKPEEDEKNHEDGDKKSDHGETVPEKADAEEKEKIEDSVKTATASGTEVPTEVQETENEPPIEISRKDKPPGTVGSLLIEATNLVSNIKEPCLFAGTNMGAIYAFELKFNMDGPVTVTLSKELHLQHKAPVILLGIVNSNHVPLVCTNEVSSYQRKSSIVEEKTEDVLDAVAPETEANIALTGDVENEEAKLKAGTLPAPHKVSDEEVEKTEPVRKSIDAGKDKAAASSTNMKKSGTLPASFLQAIGKSPANADAHELLVVSEEQVKLFSLPTLKAKYKYKVVDTGHHFSHNKSSGNQENEICQEKKAENADSTNTDVHVTKKPSRRIASVGLCKVQGTKQNKWGVSISLTNGELVALTLNNLKKYLSNIYNGSCPVLSSITNGDLNLVVSFATEQNIQVTDFSQNGVHHFESTKAILIPESARPVVKVEEKCEPSTKAEELTEETKDATDKGDCADSDNKTEHMNGHAEANEVEEGKDQMGEEALVQNPSTTHHGDITMDSIKEYITNMDGNITVKTFESSTEKHITVNDGQIVTTVHEKQTNDGDIIKDETVKITSDTVGINAISLNE